MRVEYIYKFNQPKSKEFLSVFQALNSTNPRFDILDDPKFTQVIINSGPLEYPDKLAITGYNCAKIIYKALGEKLDSVYLDDPALWEWLSYFFYDNFNATGIKHMYWYSPTKGMQNYQRWYKHFIRQAVYCYHLFGKDSEILFQRI